MSKRSPAATVPPLSYKEYAAKLRFFCRQKGLALKRLGEVDGYPLYQITAGPRRSGTTLVFSAGIHGDETSGPLAVLELVRRFNWARLRRAGVVLLPVGNPWGFDHGRRTDAAGRNLNRGFGGESFRPEQRLLHEAVSAARPVLLLTLHEDDEQAGFYLYAYGRPDRNDRTRRLIKSVGRRFMPLARGRRIDGHPAAAGVILNIRDGSLEHRVHLDSVQESLCLELPDKRPLAARVRAGEAIMSAVIRQYESGTE